MENNRQEFIDTLNQIILTRHLIFKAWGDLKLYFLYIHLFLMEAEITTQDMEIL